MSASLPDDATALMSWTWPDIAPHYAELDALPLSSQNLASFLERWSGIQDRVQETYARRYLATALDTADRVAEQQFQAYLEGIFPCVEQAEQRLKKKLLSSGLEPEGFKEPLRNMRVEAALFREDNIPLSVKDQTLTNEYDRIIGSETVQWEGEEIPIERIQAVLEDPDRVIRERAWKTMSQRQLQDREAIETLWRQLLENRQRMAANAGTRDYREFRWQQLLRLDYSPADALRFHRAIGEVVIPAMRRLHQRRREVLGVDTLRPWDLTVDTLGTSPLKPFEGIDRLVGTAATMFDRVDPVFGTYFKRMQMGGTLDLESRKNKAPGGFCIGLPLSRRPFIFMNAAGTPRDVETLLHEGGHAFHDCEMWNLPYAQQRNVGMEFAEVASMSMELLASPFLTREDGGFYDRRDAARARFKHLEQAIFLWLTIASVDEFQHWVYLHADEAMDPERCNERWLELRRRHLPEVDYSGLETELKTGWQTILHIHVVPFYIIEYGLAQLGAVQIWANARQNQAVAVRQYREALALGGTRSLPELFAAAGARLAFDANTLAQAVALMEDTLTSLAAEAA